MLIGAEAALAMSVSQTSGPMNSSENMNTMMIVPMMNLPFIQGESDRLSKPFRLAGTA
jgi:hypothetical protein